MEAWIHPKSLGLGYYCTIGKQLRKLLVSLPHKSRFHTTYPSAKFSSRFTRKKCESLHHHRVEPLFYDWMAYNKAWFMQHEEGEARFQYCDPIQTLPL